MKKLFVAAVALAVISTGSAFAQDRAPKKRVEYNGFIASPAKKGVTGLANCINDLINEGFRIKSVSVLGSIVIVDNGRCRNPADAKKIERKHASIRRIEPNVIIRLDPIERRLPPTPGYRPPIEGR